MLPKSQLKLITSLHQKKYRYVHGLFIAEGVKTVTELLEATNIKPYALYTTNEAYTSLHNNCTLIKKQELQKMSALKTPNDILGVFKIPEASTVHSNQLILALDAIRDPGNLGTIIRLCDWFGIQQLVCSSNTVDCYNPKVVQATMGSLARVNISYLDLEAFLKQQSQVPIFGTFMDGASIYKVDIPNKGIIVMGNEANGISTAIENLVTQRVGIPRFGSLKATESLNVATATAVVLSEFRRASTET